VGSYGGGDDYFSGYGLLSNASVTPSAHDFGVVPAAAAPVQDFTLTNDGPLALTVTAVTVDGPDFAVVGLVAGTVIEPGGGSVLEVHPTPHALGWRDSALAIDFDHAPRLEIPVSALAVDEGLAIETADDIPGDYRLDLGVRAVDLPPLTGHLALHDATTSPIEITDCVVSGDGFSVLAGCPLKIEPGSSAAITIAFDPAAEELYEASVRLAGSGFATGLVEIRLTGQGGSGGAPDAGNGEAADAGGGEAADAGNGEAADAGGGEAADASSGAAVDGGSGIDQGGGCGGCSTSGGADGGALLALACLVCLSPGRLRPSTLAAGRRPTSARGDRSSRSGRGGARSGGPRGAGCGSARRRRRGSGGCRR
jgi:hypothetical protein